MYYCWCNGSISLTLLFLVLIITGYRIPRVGKLEDVLDFVEHLPLIDSPEAFGLHPNADITYQSNMAKDVLDTIMNIQPKDSGSRCFFWHIASVL